ncbi:ATP-dependent helicase HrpB [Desulfovibrio cuneatus]|uniref:ATP-dependent helicase HrpB n=1 Tax=Desulfovibrio cuneatus TaxID=159728 RepID=UPI000484D7EA|nr:ATP-dependent helicase HrpB [Desulfovibrio cuneatus]
MQASFPIDTVTAQLLHALHTHKRAVLTASPGSGKTTRVPLALLGLLPVPPNTVPHNTTPLPGTILVLEPRRLAARAAARFMAGTLGEAVGQRVGYRVRLESKVSAATRVELLTEGMFTRRLLADPELSGVSCVIFDEFHERSLQADLGLALCLEAAEALRPDLCLLVMSATLDAAPISQFLGGCPVIEAKGSNWPVAIRHTRQDLTISPSLGAEDVARRTAHAVQEVLHEEPGNILVFLPGQGEIRRTAALLEKVPANTTIHPLYGDLTLAAQDAAIAPPPPGTRKVVLATDIAQTSLTIEGVRVVIDAGLARAPRFTPATGLSRLVTSRVTEDAALQRTGRAGRLEPGLCLRLWSAGEHLQPTVRPEIQEADLAPLYLEALAWGSPPATLPWLTPPPQAALNNAEETLLALNAVSTVSHANSASPLPHGANRQFTLTPHGQQLARLPLHPRLAHMVLLAAQEQGQNLAPLAACLAALVSERDPLRQNAPSHAGHGGAGADIRLRLALLRRPEHKRILAVAEQIHRSAGLTTPFHLPTPETEALCGALLCLAWPERIAQRRGPGSFRLASGQGAELAPHDPLAHEPWLAIASLGEGVNRRIHLAAPLEREDITRHYSAACRKETEVAWDDKTECVLCRETTRLGALTLQERPLPPGPAVQEQVKAAMLAGIHSLGLACLPWNDELRQWQARVLLLRTLETGNTTAAPPLADAAPHEANPWPDVSDAALTTALQHPETCWLAPWLDGVTRKSHLAAIPLANALHSLLPWPLPQKLADAAPERLALPSGNTAALDYLPCLHGNPPVLAVKLQEMFGQAETPRIAGGRQPVMLHLLSPAGRPLQVTADLHHFWQNGYKQVRAEMRGRYPRHPWPDNPMQATPTGKTKRALARE